MRFSPVELNKSGEINPEKLKSGTIVRYGPQPQYNIQKVLGVVGGGRKEGELEKEGGAEDDFFVFCSYIEIYA